MASRNSRNDAWVLDQGRERHLSSDNDSVCGANSDSETAPLLQRRDVDHARRWKSIRVMYITMFIGSVGFSIILSSVWPYLQQVDKCVTASFLGYVVAAYSVGQLIASPLFGFWANRQKSSLTPILVSLVINFLGSMMYGFSGALTAHDSTNGIFMLVSRFFIGVGAGSVSVVRAYVSAATTMEERTAAMANISAAQSLGFILGPGLAAAFRPIGETGVTWKVLRLQLNMYTLPSFLGAFLALINIGVLLMWFTECTMAFEPSISIQDKVTRSIQVNADGEESTGKQQSLCSCFRTGDQGDRGSSSTGIDNTASLICIVLFFVVLFIFSVFETILSPLSMDEFGWSGEQATLYNGIVLLSSGVVAVATFMVVKILSKRYDERNIFICGMIICSLAFVLYIPFNHGRPPLNYGNGTLTHASMLSVSSNGDSEDADARIGSDYSDISSSRSVAWTGIRASDMLPYVATTRHHYSEQPEQDEDLWQGADDEATLDVASSASATKCSNSNMTNVTSAGGCPVVKYPWCLDSYHLNFYQFLGGGLLMAVGYPTCAVMCYAIFSKILGPFPQGTMMGWLTAAGSAARAFGPMIVSNVYTAAGPRIAFACTSCFVLLAIGILLLSYKRLVPYRPPRVRS